MNRLLEKYKSEVVAALTQKFSYKNVMQVPKLEKVVINIACGDSVGNSKALESAINDLTTIAGQKPIVTRAKKSLAAWKLRKGMPIGVRVTLRDDRMYEFMERLIAVALPRIRDFKGINDKLDGKGNYTLGIQEQIIYPEIDIDKISRIFGMEITFVTSTKNDTEAYALLKAFGLPFKNAKKNE